MRKYRINNGFRTVSALFVMWLFVFVQSSKANQLPQNEIWLVNARTASWTNPNEQEFQKIQISRLNEFSGCWEKSSFDEFFESYEPDVPTVVLIHGNLFTLSDSITSGCQFSRAVLNGGHFRLVIWAWPSDKIPGIRPDVQTKAFYSEIQGNYLARFLRRFSDGSKVGLVGFSFGARMIGEAVRRCYVNGSFPVKLSVLLLAPAMDQYSVLPGGKYGTMFYAAEKSMLIYNPTDRALRYYPKMYQRGHGGPQALGRESVSLSALPIDVRAKIKAIDVSGISGRQHSFNVYFTSSSLNSKMRKLLE